MLSIGFLFVCWVSVAQGYTSKKPPFLTSQDICGIWKLKLIHEANNRQLLSSQDSLIPNTDDDSEGLEDVIVVRLSEDGTFDHHTSPKREENEAEPLPPENESQHLQHILGRGGCWEYRDQCLVLAANRPKNASPAEVKDTLLMGKLLVHVSERLMESDGTSPLDDEDMPPKENSLASKNEAASEDNNIDIDVHLSIPQGQISTGKFFYPKKHAAFFDEPMLFQPFNTGTFHMNQLLGNLNARLKSERDATKAEPVAKFHKRDFYNRTYYLTDTPHPVNQGYAAQDLYYDETKAMLDIRVMPITFYPNNTFSAIGTEKILRGRYGIMGEKRDSLWFQVSLFGAGRSAPGSVFSEGKLLSQDDRRGYVGRIQAYPNRHNQTTYFVNGEFYYGTDFKRARKPNSMGTFTLQEMDDDADEEQDENNDLNKDGNTDRAWDDAEDAFQ